MLEFEIHSSGVYSSLEFLDQGSQELPMSEIADVMIAAVHANFDAEGRPTRWADRADPTADWPILHKTGMLEDSVHAEIGSQEISVNHSTDYGDYHELGTSRMPARPFLTMESEDMDQIEQIVATWLDGLTGGH